jgi:hypothetical protein
MKTFLSIIISLLISSASFAQNAPQQVNSQMNFTQLFGAVEDSTATYLFCRANAYPVYCYNTTTLKSNLFLSDYNYWSGGNTKSGTYTSDIEFISNQPSNYFMTSNHWLGGGGGWVMNCSIFKNSNVIFNTVALYPNIENSIQNPQLLYVSPQDGYFSTAPDKSKKYLLKSVNGGDNWEYIVTDFILISLNKNNDTLLFGMDNNKLLLAKCDTALSYITVDSIFTWDNNLTKFYYSADKKHIYTTAMKGKSYNIVMSEDNGYSWKGIVAKDSSIYLTIDKNKPADLYYAVGKNIYHSSDFGNSFTLFKSLPNSIAGIYMAQNSNILYVITTTVIYKVTNAGYEALFNSPVDVKKEDHNVSSFSLLQNYPNPFNPTTRIEYKIEKAGFVSLKVYDMLGAEIATLVNQEKLPGSYSVTFDGKNLPSGVYFYRLQTGNHTATKKLSLLK